MDFRTTSTFSPMGISGGLAVPPPPPLTSMPMIQPHIPPTTSMFMYSAPGKKFEAKNLLLFSFFDAKECVSGHYQHVMEHYT
jgi:hypothetical protein